MDGEPHRRAHALALGTSEKQLSVKPPGGGPGTSAYDVPGTACQASGDAGERGLPRGTGGCASVDRPLGDQPACRWRARPSDRADRPPDGVAACGRCRRHTIAAKHKKPAGINRRACSVLAFAIRGCGDPQPTLPIHRGVCLKLTLHCLRSLDSNPTRSASSHARRALRLTDRPAEWQVSWGFRGRPVDWHGAETAENRSPEPNSLWTS